MTISIQFGEKTVRVAVEINGAIESAVQFLPEREWVGLTEDEIKEIFYANGKNAQFWWEYANPDCVAIGRAIETKLKEKNK